MPASWAKSPAGCVSLGSWASCWQASCWAPRSLGAEPDTHHVVFTLFFATALSISALPVIAKMLIDLNLFRSDLGMIIVAAAIRNDLLGWMIFAMVLSMLGESHANGFSLGATIGLTLGFAAAMLTLGRWLIDRVLPWIQAHTTWPAGVLGFGLTLAPMESERAQL